LRNTLADAAEGDASDTKLTGAATTGSGAASDRSSSKENTCTGRRLPLSVMRKASGLSPAIAPDLPSTITLICTNWALVRKVNCGFGACAQSTAPINAPAAAGRCQPIVVQCTPLGLEGLLDAGAGPGEQSGTVGSDVHVIFQSHSEFPNDVDAGLVAEGHVRLNRALVAAHQVVPLVAVHADAVPEAVAEILVIGAEAAVAHHLARCGIHGLHGRAHLGGSQRRLLRLVHDVEDALHLIGGLAQHKRAGDVALVALGVAAIIEHDHRSLDDVLGRNRAMRQGGVFANVDAGSALQAGSPVAGGDPGGNLLLGHARLKRLPYRLVHRERGIVRDLHQGELGWAFH